MRKIMAVMATGLLGLSIATSSMADSHKIAAIDIQKIMQSWSEVAATSAKLQKEFKPREDKTMALRKELEGKIQQLKTVTKPADKEKLQADIINKQASYETLVNSMRQDMMTAQNKAMQQIIQRINEAAAAVAVKNEYDLVLQLNALPYVNPKLNVTDAVLKELQKKPL